MVRLLHGRNRSYDLFKAFAMIVKIRLFKDPFNSHERGVAYSDTPSNKCSMDLLDLNPLKRQIPCFVFPAQKQNP